MDHHHADPERPGFHGMTLVGGERAYLSHLPMFMVPHEYQATDDLYLAQVITRPPDFDQIIGVHLQDHPLTDDDLRHGAPVTFPGRPNAEQHKLTEGETVIGRIGGVDVPLTVGSQRYFETDDLKD